MTQYVVKQKSKYFKYNYEYRMASNLREVRIESEFIFSIYISGKFFI